MNWYKKQIFKYAYQKGRSWTPEELEKIKQLTIEGKRFSDIGKLFGVSERPIIDLNKKYKWRPGRVLFSPDEETIKKIDHLYNIPPHGEGLTFEEVASRLGIDRTTLKLFFAKTGRRIRSKEEQRKIHDPQKSDKWDEVEKNIPAIQEMIDDGYTGAEIAKLFDVGYPLMSKMLGRFNIHRSYDSVKQKAQKLLEQGFTLSDISKKLRTDPKTIKQMLDIPTKKINYVGPGDPISEDEGNKIVNMHIEEGLRPTEIGKAVNREVSTIVGYLRRRGVYNQLRKDRVEFSPTEEEIRKIDYWYALPPDGEGKSLVWIGKQFGLSGGQMWAWFHKTGRPTRDFREQVATSHSREQVSFNKEFEWLLKGGLEGYLKSLSKEKAIEYLNGFVWRIYQQDPIKASAIKNKYLQIINNHTFPDEIKQ